MNAHQQIRSELDSKADMSTLAHLCLDIAENVRNVC